MKAGFVPMVEQSSLLHGYANLRLRSEGIKPEAGGAGTGNHVETILTENDGRCQGISSLPLIRDPHLLN